MRKLILLLLLLAAGAQSLRAQSILNIPIQQCVWRYGDDPAWASPTLDDSSWQPYAAWRLDPRQPRLWVRCHADLSSLRGAGHPSLQVRLPAAYQLFMNGESIGEAGGLRTGHFSMDLIHNFPLPDPIRSDNVLALRVTARLFRTVPAVPLDPLALWAGDPGLLADRSAALGLRHGYPRLTPAICFSIIGVVGFVLLGLFLSDRTRRELLPLAIVSIVLVPLYLNYFLAASLVGYPSYIYLLAWALAAIGTNTARVVFFFAVAGRRVPWIFRVLIVAGVAGYAATAFGVFLPAALALRLDAFRVLFMEPCTGVARIGEGLAPFVAFWPWWRLQRRMRPLAASCMVWGATMVIFFSVQILNLGRSASLRSSTIVANAEAVTTLLVVITLLALLFRDQRRIADDRATLSGEMQAAREIQQRLVPSSLPQIHRFRLDAAYRPAAEVGGDFYQIIQQSGGSAILVIGDVSGKGLRAAMTGTLVLGALRSLAQENLSPSQILMRLNTQLAQSSDGGFVTCLCVRIGPDGTLTLANAGHLAPYCNGDELKFDSGLPLGITADSQYTESSLTLVPGDNLTFLSDGVVEARNAAGELYGFERTAAISTQPAEVIARAASTFGQEDDITVLTLSFAPAEVAHA